MAKVLYHITMSLDGFVAPLDSSVDWMKGHEPTPNPVVDEVLGKIGAILIGNRTYRSGPEGEAYGGAVKVPTFVLTHDDPASAPEGVTFVGGDITTALDQVKQAAGDRYVALLGPEVARHCLDAGILDEVLVHIIPTLLGEGTRVFQKEGGTEVRLVPISITSAGKFTNIWARVPG